MKRIYKYVSLVAAKLVGRRHVRDIQLPGLRELKNAFVSKSDNAITCRPDFDPIAEDLLAVSDGFVTTTPDDYINSVSGIYGTDDLLWFSNNAPVTWDGTTSEIACSNYTTGTVTASSGQTELAGVGTLWRQNVWVGCWIEMDGDGKRYKISEVNNNTTIVVSENLTDSYSGVSYVIYRPHQPDHADYKLNLQPFTSGMIYSCPTITMPVDAKKICGPFYASVIETSSEEAFIDYVDDTDIDFASSGQFSAWSVATSGSKWMAVCPSSSGQDPKLMVSTNPGNTTSWSQVASYPSDFTFSGIACCIYDGTYFCVSGLKTSTGKAAFAYSVDGASWTLVENSALTPNAFVFIASDGAGTIVMKSADADFAYYTTDRSTWTQATIGGNLSTATSCSGMLYGDSTFVMLVPNGYKYSSTGADFDDSGSTWTTCESGAYSTEGDFWLFGFDGQYDSDDMVKVTTLGGGYERTGGAVIGQPTGITWAGDKFLVSCSGRGEENIYSSTDGIVFEIVHTFDPVDDKVPHGGSYSSITGETVYLCRSYLDDGAGAAFAVSGQTQVETSWKAASFEPLSDEYRALSHSVLDGYVMLLGVREWNAISKSWNYYPRRIRWTAPLTYNDFESSGSGSADLDGSGALLDSRAVNGRIATFESSQIGAISPRGFSTDPWEYDVIKQNIRAISNPVVIDDMCYFVDDSGLMRVTNGITVEEPPFPFDLTEYDDFNADMPIWLVYYPELESIGVFNAASSNYDIFLIEVGQGLVSKVSLSDIQDKLSRAPKSIVAVEHSSDRRLMVGYNPLATDTDSLLVSELSAGDVITGVDENTTDPTLDTYWATDIQTPEDWIVQEGKQTGIKHIIARTYCDGSNSSTNPVLTVMAKSLEDTTWNDNGDATGTITVTTAACTGTGTAWSNTLDASADPVYTTPCLATQARVYDNDVLQVLGTDYTITDTKQITLSGAAAGTVKVYWENEPSVKAKVGDLIQTTDGWHRVTGITSATEMTLDHYLSSGSDATATHHPAERLPVGDGEVKIGLTKLTEGVRLRFIIMPDASGDATVAKITGYSIGHLPAGEKIVET